MQFRQHRDITTELKGPFWLTKVPKAINSRITRKRFACGFKAVAELQRLKLSDAVWYGAAVNDDNGVLVAELE